MGSYSVMLQDRELHCLQPRLLRQAGVSENNSGSNDNDLLCLLSSYPGPVMLHALYLILTVARSVNTVVR